MLGSLRIPLLVCGISTMGVFALNSFFFIGQGNVVHADDGITRSEYPETEASLTVKEIVQRESIPYTTLRKSSSELRSGTSKTVQTGKNGEKQVKYKVYSKGEEEVRREAFATSILRKPVQEIVKVGT